MIKYMLDTDISVYTIKRKPHTVKRMFNNHFGEMAISTVTLGKLLYFSENSSEPQQNRMQIEGYAARLDILDYDQAAAAQLALMI